MFVEKLLADAKKSRPHDPDAAVRNRPNPVFPSNSPNVTDDRDHFPIGSEKQARSALAYGVKLYNQWVKNKKPPKWLKGLTPKEFLRKIVNKVKKLYPKIEIGSDVLQNLSEDEVVEFFSGIDDTININYESGGETEMNLEERLSELTEKIKELNELMINAKKDDEKNRLQLEIDKYEKEKEVIELSAKLEKIEAEKKAAESKVNELADTVAKLNEMNKTLRENEKAVAVEQFYNTLIDEGHYPAFAEVARDIVKAAYDSEFQIELSDNRKLTNIVEIVKTLADAIPENMRVQTKSITKTFNNQDGDQLNLTEDKIENLLRSVGATTRKSLNVRK